MSLVVFPFRQEDLSVITGNLKTAAGNDHVREVWAVAAADGRSMQEVSLAAREVSASLSVPIKVFAQERVGTRRPGKGDGVNTAIKRAADSGFARVHFYDADITNFDDGWIDGAEAAADLGFGVVRHRFPRASTDGLVTWMVTRPALAMLFPGTVLPRLGQPLGGELLLTGPVVEALATDPFVVDRSDWGIDTVLTHATTTMGSGLYEHNVADGKRHALYGSLDEIRDMVVECLDAARSLAERPGPSPEALVELGPPAAVPQDLKDTVAYDINETMSLLTSGWTAEEAELCSSLPSPVGESLILNRSEPTFSFMDEVRWGQALGFLLEEFTLGDPAWESMAFRLWVARVLAYTTSHALSGFDRAMGYLESTIRGYETAARKDGGP